MATERLAALGYILLSWTLRVYTVAHCVCWTLPCWAWLSATGQLPPLDDPCPGQAPSNAERWTDTTTEGTC